MKEPDVEVPQKEFEFYSSHQNTFLVNMINSGIFNQEQERILGKLLVNKSYNKSDSYCIKKYMYIYLGNYFYHKIGTERNKGNVLAPACIVTKTKSFIGLWKKYFNENTVFNYVNRSGVSSSSYFTITDSFMNTGNRHEAILKYRKCSHGHITREFKLTEKMDFIVIPFHEFLRKLVTQEIVHIPNVVFMENKDTVYLKSHTDYSKVFEEVLV